MSRRSPWVQISDKAYDLALPNPEILSIGDVARGLAYLNRYTGQAGGYSVAQHCVLGARALRDEGQSAGVQAAFLIHDAHEIVTGDVTSPVKVALRDVFGCDAWERFERAHRVAFAIRFGTPREIMPAVRRMDLRMLVTEARDLLPPPPRDWGIPEQPIESLRIYPWDPIQAGAEYRIEAERLGVS